MMLSMAAMRHPQNRLRLLAIISSFFALNAFAQPLTSELSASENDSFSALSLPRPAETAPENKPEPEASPVTADSQPAALATPGEQLATPDEPSAPEGAEEAEAEPSAEAAKALEQTKIHGTLSLRDAGIIDGLKIDGHQTQSGFTFTLPGDRVITSAHLLLKIKVSNELVDGQHYLNLMLNGQDMGQLPLSQAVDDINSFNLEIPAPMLVSVNNLSITLDNSKALQCEVNSDVRYQLQVMPDSQIDYEGLRLNIAPTLSRFPWPFLDTYEMGRSQVGMVFTATPDADALTAAAVVSGYLGYHADYKGVDIPVSLGRLPESSAIVFAHAGATIGDFTIPEHAGASLWITDNPNNPVSKLLVVSGHNKNEFLSAAYALTHNTLPAGALLEKIAQHKIPARVPYDAPRWVNTERPVTLSSLMKDDSKLVVRGINHENIRVAFRAAPDLFMWEGSTIPISMGYHFPSNEWLDEAHSLLGVSLNGHFLRTLPVNKSGAIETLWHTLGGYSRQEQKTLHIQPYQIYGDNQFEFWFSVKPKPDAPCQVLSDNTIKSFISPDSTIDLSHTWHFSELPNLSYFIGASFPFSRQADLAQTAVLLAEHPQETEISTLMTLMARSGNATGVTTHGMQIYLGDKVLHQNPRLLKGKDLLVVATMSQRPLLQTLLAKSPFETQEGQLLLRPINYWQQALAFLKGDWGRDGKSANRYLSYAGEWRGFISYQSPWDKARSVVIATATQDEQLALLPADLRNPTINAGIRGDIAIIDKTDGVHSWTVGPHYVSGQMPWYLQIIWYANQHIVVLGLICALLAGAMGLLAYAYLKNQAEQRLKNFIGHRR
ncbi:cellulose biosynthesis cyclic di-GMP-binding regulatory protein BcsB [Hafnia alvei]|uniref:cellulose biosynthesis cyclic di-GMP-binding regulatory protein BcsB n=1 Tax=Hafnia alvei TaxID=569 RepID=UPI000694AE80|nr:cellulose biosynthesis cyclic di-GMP-binding regulatory protein BcsB [Hafnia alvei]